MEFKGVDIDKAEMEHRLARPTIGHLMWDPTVPEETLKPICDALLDTGLIYTVSFVENYFSPCLRTSENVLLIGNEAIIAYARNFKQEGRAEELLAEWRSKDPTKALHNE